MRALLLATASAVLAPTAPTVELAGVKGSVHLPLVGLGTWLYDSAKTQGAVGLALENGYRHIDTALIYDNQVGVGKAVAASGLTRAEVFITSKVPGGSNFSATAANLEACLSQLNMDYVDLMLVHFPATMTATPVGSPKLRQEQWLALEAFAKAGKARAIGVSHYCSSHIHDVLEVATLPVALNQVQYHVGMGPSGPLASDDKQFMDAVGIRYMSFSPLCGPCGTPELINGTLVTGVGAKYQKSGAQVALKWLAQQGIPVIPKTASLPHMLQNIDLFDWELSQADMQTLTLANSPPVAGAPGGGSGDCAIKALYA